MMEEYLTLVFDNEQRKVIKHFDGSWDEYEDQLREYVGDKFTLIYIRRYESKERRYDSYPKKTV
ncbi:hypothetical protein LCGC14_1973770 [marine sediment metagenome]|uniref:Uncharacterized protein n=1 Tax=marine sediment metagenome TaxID=412755 RepID=A0A0F9FBD7_9ZZZZ